MPLGERLGDDGDRQTRERGRVCLSINKIERISILHMARFEVDDGVIADLRKAVGHIHLKVAQDIFSRHLRTVRKGDAGFERQLHSIVIDPFHGLGQNPGLGLHRFVVDLKQLIIHKTVNQNIRDIRQAGGRAERIVVSHISDRKLLTLRLLSGGLLTRFARSRSVVPAGTHAENHD